MSALLLKIVRGPVIRSAQGPQNCRSGPDKNVTYFMVLYFRTLFENCVDTVIIPVWHNNVSYRTKTTIVLAKNPLELTMASRRFEVRERWSLSPGGRYNS